MLRIVMVSFAGTGGHPVYVNAVLESLYHQRSKGVVVDFLAPADLEEQYLSKDYIVHRALPAYPEIMNSKGFIRRIQQVIFFIKSYWRSFQWLKKQKNLGGVHFQDSLWLLGFFFWIYRFLNVPLFFTIHNIKPHKYSGLMPNAFEDFLYRSIWRSCDGLFVHSENLKQEAINLLGKGCPPIYVVPHGLFAAEGGAIQPLSERMSWKKFLFFGDIRRNKGLHFLLQALATCKGFSLTIAGRKQDERYWNSEIVPLIKLRQTEGVSVEVIDSFVPENKVADLFYSHSAVILSYTSDFHSQSGVLHLAIALNTPVVVTNVGGIGDLVMQFNIGEVSPPDNFMELSNAMQRLYKRNPSELVESFKKSQEDLSWSKLAQCTCEAYKSSTLG